MRDQDSLEDFLQHLTTHHDEYQALQHKLNGAMSSHITTLEYQLVELPSLIAKIGKLNRYQYRYTLEVEVFADCVASHLLSVNHLEFATVCRYPAILQMPDNLQYARMTLSRFLQYLYQRLNSSEFLHQAREQQKSFNRTLKNKQAYIDGLFAHYARLVVIRLDLSYLKDADISVEQLEFDLERLNNRMKYHHLFDHKVGHLFRIEYGLDKGLHVHCLFFFDGSKRQGLSDWHIAKSIGDCWRDEIVSGDGNYWSCHDNKDQYAYLGIGDIHYTDVEMVNNLKNHVVSYFCLRKQYIKPTYRRMQLIRSGNALDDTSPKRGRPRTSFDLYDDDEIC